MTPPREFDVTSPLHQTITLLEASAGTGKTYQITNLVLRLVTEPEPPVRMGQLLVVTFTKAATAELVDRIRSRLALAVRVVRRCASAPDLERALVDSGADDTLARLVRRAAAEPGRLERHLERLARAQEEFDQALISTIHGFCQRMLQQNAFESLVDFGLELVQDDQPLVDEIVDDFISSSVNNVDEQRHAFLVDDCGFSRDKLGKLASKALSDPRMLVDPPADAQPQPREQLLQDFADWWESQGMAELAQAFDAAATAGDIVPKGKSKTQSTYVSKKCLVNGGSLLVWVRALLAGEDPGDCPAANYWSPKGIKGYSHGRCAWHHPHLDRVRRVLEPGAALVDIERSSFVAHVRLEFERRNLQRRKSCFQDLLRLLAIRLEDRDKGELLRRAIAPRFRAALIDEFQDTDPEQWTIFRTLFGQGDHFLYLIGDPKQAIYGFRGANVNVYLDAKRVAGDRVFSMNTNFRSDGRFLRALEPILAAPQPPDAKPDLALTPEGMFALRGIAYEPVVANPGRKPSVRLLVDPERPETPASALAPLQLRFFDASSDVVFVDDGSSPDPLTKGRAQVLLPGIVTADIVQLLHQGLRFFDSEDSAWRSLSPGEIAVLVRTGKQARAVQAALLGAGVPCVLPGADSVLSTDEARDLQLWLEAVQSPGSDRAARAAVTTPMFGRTAADLRALDDESAAATANDWWDKWLGQLARWQTTFQRHGVMRAFRAAMLEHAVQKKLLAWPDGERRLTNLLHLLELLHAAQVHEHYQLSGLVRWLASQRQKSQVDAETGELRLERDDKAVRVLTMHKAKGLQFPVVFAPYLWDGTLLHRTDEDAPVVSLSEGSPQRVLDVHSDASVDPKRARLILAEREAWQGNMRLAYVALTRTEQRCVVYTGHVKDFETSPLGVLLHSLPPGATPGSVGDRLRAALSRVGSLGSSQLSADLRALEARLGSEPGLGALVHVSRCAAVTTAPRWKPEQGSDSSVDKLAARVFRRRHPSGDPKGLDHGWKRASYTSITKSRSHERDRQIEREVSSVGVVSEQEALAKDYGQEDESDSLETTGLAPSQESALRAALPVGDVAKADVPLAAFRAGADAGTFLHELFEHLDFTAFAHREDDLEGAQAAQGELHRVIAERGPLHGFDTPHWRELLLAGIPGVIRTPLGGDLGAVRLADIPAARRLNELVFDLPLAGGDQHRRPDASGAVRFTQRISGRDFGQAFLLGRGHPQLRDAYLEKLAAGWQRQRFAGYLTGSIDLVFATPPEPNQRARRFYVLDYKSNRLDLLRERCTPRSHFCPDWMLHEMEHHDYLVQAYLYTLALHRYLRQRLPGYRPDVNLGGAVYLFVRGACGPERPPGSEHPYGVFFHRPVQAVIERLDQLFEGGASVGAQP